MQTILILGAGKSSSSLIKYLAENAASNNWKIIVADMDMQHAQQKIKGFTNCSAIAFDVTNEPQRKSLISESDIIISMLPAFMHLLVAKDCLTYKKNLVTASYVSPEIKAMESECKKQGLLFLNEMGLDPGLDHMSAMRIIHQVKAEGGSVSSFKSYCGGLIAPESDTNPWNYKFTWNPRNVILAGQSTACYLNKGELKFIPPQRIFSDIEQINIKGHGSFDAYANRDSLSYIVPYGLEKTKTVLRGTLRKKNFCKKWNALVHIGLTNDNFQITDLNKLTYKQLLNGLLPAGKSLASFIKSELNISKSSEIYDAINWLGLESNKKIPLTSGSPAQVLQNLLEQKWELKSKDKDMIVMYHEFGVIAKNKKPKKITSSLILTGKDTTHTAMAMTVGLPLAIGVKLILQNKLKLTGVQIPIYPEVYNPILNELETIGIHFIEN